MATTHRCIPLCYPDNYQWDNRNGVLIENGITGQRSKMVVCDEALSILQTINHPVCVVAVVGDRRTGKSYILSQLQEPRASECVFGISSAMKANTIGIWMNSKPFIKTLHDGTQVAMVLLDTEGLGSIETMGEYDHHILTLVVLLSSVLIYNGSGLVKADDLRKLRCVADLATRIQVRTNESESGSSVEFYKFFPNFHWLLRDVLLIPTITRNGVEEEVEIKDYILEEIFKRETTTSAESRRHAGIGNAILRFFPTFNAYSLPLPSLNPQVVKNIEDPKFQDQINPIFLEKVNDFIGSLHGYLKPKKAWPKAGHVTGKQLSELVKVYTAMLAKPGAIPNVQSAWDQILTAQLEASLNKATQLYETNMDIFVCENIPCEEVFIMEKHGVWFDQASKMFYEEVNTINDADLVSKYYRKFQNHVAQYGGHQNLVVGGLLFKYVDENKRKSEILCKEIVAQLKTENLPQLTPDRYNSFQQVEEAIAVIAELYETNARGPMATQIKKELFEACEEFYFDNIRWLRQLPGFKTPEMTQNRKRQYEAFQIALVEKERALETEKIILQKQEEIEKARQLYESAKDREIGHLHNELRNMKTDLDEQAENFKKAKEENERQEIALRERELRREEEALRRTEEESSNKLDAILKNQIDLQNEVLQLKRDNARMEEQHMKKIESLSVSRAEKEEMEARYKRSSGFEYFAHAVAGGVVRVVNTVKEKCLIS